MDEKDTDFGTGESTPPPPPGAPRSINLAAVAGGILIIGLIAFALYRRGATVSPEAAPQDQAQQAVPVGTAIATAVPVALTPEASILAERYHCVCGCEMTLSACTCNQSPGSNEMKLFLLNLVMEKHTSAEIDQAMMGKWGSKVLIRTRSAVAPKRPPKPPKARPDMR